MSVFSQVVRGGDGFFSAVVASVTGFGAEIRELRDTIELLNAECNSLVEENNDLIETNALLREGISLLNTHGLNDHQRKTHQVRYSSR